MSSVEKPETNRQNAPFTPSTQISRHPSIWLFPFPTPTTARTWACTTSTSPHKTHQPMSLQCPIEPWPEEKTQDSQEHLLPPLSPGTTKSNCSRAMNKDILKPHKHIKEYYIAPTTTHSIHSHTPPQWTPTRPRKPNDPQKHGMPPGPPPNHTRTIQARHKTTKPKPGWVHAAINAEEMVAVVIKEASPWVFVRNA